MREDPELPSTNNIYYTSVRKDTKKKTDFIQFWIIPRTKHLRVQSSLLSLSQEILLSLKGHNGFYILFFVFLSLPLSYKNILLHPNFQTRF